MCIVLEIKTLFVIKYKNFVSQNEGFLQFLLFVTNKLIVFTFQEVAAKAGVTAMPTFIAYRNELKLDECVGASDSKLSELFMKHRQRTTLLLLELVCF